MRDYWSYCGEIEKLDVMRFPDTGRFKGIALHHLCRGAVSQGGGIGLPTEPHCQLQFQHLDPLLKAACNLGAALTGERVPRSPEVSWYEAGRADDQGRALCVHWPKGTSAEDLHCPEREAKTTPILHQRYRNFLAQCLLQHCSLTQAPVNPFFQTCMLVFLHYQDFFKTRCAREYTSSAVDYALGGGGGRLVLYEV